MWLCCPLKLEYVLLCRDACWQSIALGSNAMLALSFMFWTILVRASVIRLGKRRASQCDALSVTPQSSSPPFHS